MIFDSETIGKVSQDIINFGYKIIDLNVQHAEYTTLCEKDYIVSDLINNKIYCLNDDFVGVEKYGKFISSIESKLAIKHSIPMILKAIASDIKKYGVLFAYAYNCDFDIDKLLKVGFEFPIPAFDIWAYAYEYIIKTQEYKNFCIENDLLTATQRFISGNVESITKYLTNDLSFVESHTALSDCQNECNILVECVKRGCDITRPLPKAKNVESDKVLTKTIKLPDGHIINVEYKSVFERGGVITYK